MAEARTGTRTPPATYLPFWYQALAAEIGIYIRCTERRKLVGALYEARSEAADSRLEALMIFQPSSDLVYIAKKAVELES